MATTAELPPHLPPCTLEEAKELDTDEIEGRLTANNFFLDLAKASTEPVLTEVAEIRADSDAVSIDLANKEHLLQAMRQQIKHLHEVDDGADEPRGITSSLDPNINRMFSALQDATAKAEACKITASDDLLAWKATQDSKEFEYLKDKCVKAILKNQALGEQLKAQQVAKLDAQIKAQKDLRTDLIESESEIKDIVRDLNRQLEMMHAKIFVLQSTDVHKPRGAKRPAPGQLQSITTKR